MKDEVEEMPTEALGVPEKRKSRPFHRIAIGCADTDSDCALEVVISPTPENCPRSGVKPRFKAGHLHATMNGIR